jgi:hypothetical protein
MESTNTHEISATSTPPKRKSANVLRDEKYLILIANIILIVGIVISFILLFTVVFVSEPQNYYSAEGDAIASGGVTKVFNASRLLIMISTLFSSVILWAFLRVISNISVTLKEIKGTIQTNSNC